MKFGQGKLIVLEGMDACGKATQAARLAKTMDAKLFSFPDYSGPGGNAVKQLLTGAWRIVVDRMPARATTEDLLVERARSKALAVQSFHAVSRYEHADEIQKTLASGQHVVCDRYLASGIVYGEADGLPLDWLWKIHESLPQPDSSVLIDIPPEESVRRRPERRDDYEKRAGFMEKVRAGYLRLFEERSTIGPGRWHIVPGLGTEDDVAFRIGARLTTRYCEAGR